MKNINNKNNPFKVPSNYFEELNNELDTRIIEESFNKESGFKIPDNYFTNFNVELKEPKVIKFNGYLFTKISAAIILLVSITLIITKTNSDTSSLMALNNEDLDYWIENSADYIELDEVLENIDLSENYELQSTDIIDYFENSDIEYILNENDINTL